jgi:membrane protein YdbS with pleckstrin-like domain
MAEEEGRGLNTRRLAFMFYSFLLLLGVLFYLSWGVFFGTWNPFAEGNIGVYAITILLVLFGLVGMLLYYKE